MKSILKNYTFNTSAKTITLTDISTIRLDRLLLITDVTINKILYNFADSTVATATVATNVVTLSALQGGESNSDKLQVIYDTLPADAAFGDTTEAVQVLNSVLPTGAALDATLTGGTQQTKITDGTNVANTLKSDGTAAGQNSQLVAGTGLNLTGLTAGSLNADLIALTDVTNYKGANITITGTFTGTLTIQGSNDNSVFFSVAFIGSDNSATSSGTFAAAGSVQTTKIIPIYFKYLRVRMTAYTSGTATGSAQLLTVAPYFPLPVMQQSGTWNTGTPSATINIGQTTSAVTAVQLSATSTIPTNGLIIQALSTNTASVFIGGSGVTTANGFELTAGSSLTITSNLNTVYVIGSNATDKVCWSVT